MDAFESAVNPSPQNLTGGDVEEKDRQFGAALARGFEVLRCFTPFEPSLGHGEISRRTGLPKPTVSRLTYTLTKLGYLRHNGRTGKYQLGSAVLSIGYPLLASMSAHQLVRPHMDRLAECTHGAVAMGMRDRLNMVYVETCVNGSAFSVIPDIGASPPIAGSAMGHAYLAACSPPEREALINQMQVKTPDLYREFQGAIEKSLEDVEVRGFCVLRRKLCAVGVPMRRQMDGEIVAFNCCIPAFALRGSQLEDEIGPRLVAMVRSVEAALGLQ